MSTQKYKKRIKLDSRYEYLYTKSSDDEENSIILK